MATISYSTSSGVTTTTSVTNGVSYTQNVINLGDSGACSSTPTYCQDGYSLYVPCLKQITRGQRVCFQMYVADMANQDVLDLNDLCGMTLQLSGVFGCTYGEYTYPDDIVSLQSEELVEVKCEEFTGDTVRLDLGYLEYSNNSVTEPDEVNVSEDGLNVDVVGTYGDFYKGETPYLKAEDSTTHIFMGWTSSDRMSELCDTFSINDLIITDEHEWVWDEPIDHDITLYAIYRKRKTYTIRINYENRHSYFMVTYQGKKKMLSDKQRDYVEVMEGYHFIVKCVPLTTKDKSTGASYTYNFYRWSDGYSKQVREYLVEDSLFSDGELLLLATCSDEKVESSKSMNLSSASIDPTPDDFETNLPDENVLGYKSIVYETNDVVTECSNIYQVYDPDNENLNSYITLTPDGFVSFDSGSEGGELNLVLTIDTSNLTFNEVGSESEEEVPVGNIIVKNGDNTITVGLTSSDDSEIVIELGDCEDGVVDIYTDIDELHIGKICVYEKVITNKGLIELCVPPEDTLKWYPGVLNASGAICVNDEWYGIDTVQIGVVNKLAPITIIS